MKKLIFFSFFILLISCKAQTSKKSLFLKVGYLPNNEYHLTQNQNSENIVTYSGSVEIMNNLKKNGVDNPQITKTSSILDSKTSTGNIKDTIFPIEVELLKSVNEQMKKGTKFYGYSNQNGQIKIDSIYSDNMKDDFKQSLIKSMQDMMNKSLYPEKEIKIGESFEKRTPLSIPISDVNIDFEIFSIYTLKDINNDIGYFDLKQEYILKSTSKDYKIELTGFGNGVMEYDIHKEFFVKFDSEMEMNVKAELENLTIDLISKSVTKQKTEIK